MRMERNFGATAPYTVGVEEELQLVDPTSFALVPAIDAVLAASHTAKLPEDSIASELSASCVEVRSPVYGTVAELAAELPVLRRRLRDLVEGCGARLAAAGAHPFSKATAQQITGKERYRRVDKEMGWPARMQAIYGLHVHVAVPDEERAIRAVAALSRYVPLFVALSANSPFWEAEDTCLASIRTKVFGLMPRSALPPAFRAWARSSSARRTCRRRPTAPPHWPRSPSASWRPPTSTRRRIRCSPKRTRGARPATALKPASTTSRWDATPPPGRPRVTS